jgi:hypothetical protein
MAEVGGQYLSALLNQNSGMLRGLKPEENQMKSVQVTYGQRRAATTQSR